MIRALLCCGLLVFGGCVRWGHSLPAAPEAPATLFQLVTSAAFADSGATWGGCAVDIDGDGLRDIVMSRHGSRVAFYKNRGGLAFEEIGRDWDLPTGLHDLHAIAVHDFDRDDDYDLYLTVGADRGRGKGANQLWENRGLGRYENIALSHPALADSTGRGRGAAWMDLDGDAVPEIFVGNFRSPSRLLERGPSTWFDARARFQSKRQLPLDVADEETREPPAQLPDWWLLSAGDLNDDGRVDLIAPKSGSALYLNSSAATLIDVGKVLGLQVDNDAVTTAALGDIDADGDLDILFAFKGFPGLSLWKNDQVAEGWRFRRDLRVEDLPVDGVIQSAHLADFDNDGFLDLYVVREREGRNFAPNVMARGNGDGSFEQRVSAWGATADVSSLVHSALPVDLDNDGDLDLVCFNGREAQIAGRRAGVVLVYENQSMAKGITLELKSVTGAAEGLGARVELWMNGRWWRQEMRSVASPYSSMVAPLHFGVGDHEGPFRVRVHWRGGAESQEFELPIAGAAYRLSQGKGVERLAY